MASPFERDELHILNRGRQLREALEGQESAKEKFETTVYDTCGPNGSMTYVQASEALRGKLSERVLSRIVKEVAARKPENR